MSPSEEDDVFQNAGETDCASPDLRQSTRTFTRKRASTGSAPYSKSKPMKNKKEKGMSVAHTPALTSRQGQEAGRPSSRSVRKPLLDSGQQIGSARLYGPDEGHDGRDVDRNGRPDMSGV